MNSMVLDLSHWDGTVDYVALKAKGVKGIIYKATEGTTVIDNTYALNRAKAKDAGLLWGAYHFGNAQNTGEQADSFLERAKLDSGDLFCLDHEPNPKSQMSLIAAKYWIADVEKSLNRPANSCVYYSGNLIKELLEKTKDTFLGARRLWLAQYGPTAKVQASWEDYWLWQWTEAKAGVKGSFDANHFDGTDKDLADQWANGFTAPAKPEVTLETRIAYLESFIQGHYPEFDPRS